MPLPIRINRPHENSAEPMQVDVPPENNHATNEDTFIIESATLDLDVYASNYTGLTKLNRLLFVARHCPLLEIDALRIALTYVKQTFNVQLYQDIMKTMTEACIQNEIEPPPIDTTWMETTSKKAALKFEKLDSDLKNYKSNSIKESIRRGHDDLGDHHFECGDLNNALKCYSRARDYCMSAKQVVNMCVNVIKVSIHLGNWSHVLNYVNKAENTSELAEQKDRRPNLVTLTRLKCAAGLAELASRKYKSAAKNFLQSSFDNCECPEIISPNNVAIYGGLCALATFERQELQKKVLSSSSFKLFLELEPQLRDVLYKFHESQYAACLKLLDEMKDNFMLDMYLSPHVHTLYSQIRNRALVQYFSPYVSADMEKMARAFNTTVPKLEDELSNLILEGQIQARIDSHNKVLFARNVDQRSVTFEKALEMGKEYHKRTKALILRGAILRNQIVVKSPPRESSSSEVSMPVTR